jgi:capsular polysaccharide transport system permease protein
MGRRGAKTSVPADLAEDLCDFRIGRELGNTVKISRHFWIKGTRRGPQDTSRKPSTGQWIESRMSEDPDAVQRRIAVARNLEAIIAENREVNISSTAAADASRPRLIGSPLQEPVAVPAGEQRFTQELKRRFALPRITVPRFTLPGFIIPVVKISPLYASFVGCVLVPAFAATVYFAFIASSQFTAEARFAVRQLDVDSSASTASAANSSSDSNGGNVNFSFTGPGQNAYIVTSYIRSRAIVDDLNAKIDVRKIFRRPEADFWARLKRNASIDELADYWNSMVATYIDAPSGIVTLQVRAFRADDAVALAKSVLELSEMLVNRISDRARHDAMEMSEKEVRRTYEMTQAALTELRQFRDSSGIIDPAQAGTEIGKLLLPLLTEKIRLEGDLFVASRDLDDSAPTIKALKNRLETVEQQITALKGRLTNTDDSGKTISASLAKFEEIDLQRQFAEKLYALAQADLDRARLRAARQSVYLTVFVPPSLPEDSRYPRRVAFPILILVGLAIVWSIGGMIFASVEDHRL